MTDWLSITRGEAPLLVSIPHAGTIIPAGIEAALVDPRLARFDADWHLEHLYDFAAGLGATVVRTTISRTVIDVNRDPSGASLYPGQATTGLCPLTTFDGSPLYQDGREPDEAEIERRRRTYFEPYHAALQAELARLRARHARVVLYEAHSIRSHVPRLFDGQLPQFNIGTNSGRSCAPALREAVGARCDASGLPTVVDGRFKGGWITRHYGAPQRGVHALQLEICQCTYMDEAAPFGYRPDRAASLQPLLQRLRNAVVQALP
jgi:formiminoglutamase